MLLLMLPPPHLATPGQEAYPPQEAQDATLLIAS